MLKLNLKRKIFFLIFLKNLIDCKFQICGVRVRKSGDCHFCNGCKFGDCQICLVCKPNGKLDFSSSVTLGYIEYVAMKFLRILPHRECEKSSLRPWWNSNPRPLHGWLVQRSNHWGPGPANWASPVSRDKRNLCSYGNEPARLGEIPPWVSRDLTQPGQIFPCEHKLIAGLALSAGMKASHESLSLEQNSCSPSGYGRGGWISWNYTCIFVLPVLSPGQTRMRVDASWQTRVCMHGLAWLFGQTRTRVDESWPEINQKNAQKLRPFCWACCYKVETASRSNEQKLSLTCIKIWDSSKLTRVDASWRSNASETCNSD